MKYFLMNGRIDKEIIEKFVSFYNDNHTEPCVIILNTAGGDTYVAESITHMINEMANVKLIINAVYSAGFEIAFYCKCRKLLSKTAKGMLHYGRAEISLNTKEKPYYIEDECIIKNLPIERKSSEKLAKKVMTTKEFKDFKEDKDIYFDFARMKEIFPDAEIMK